MKRNYLQEIAAIQENHQRAIQGKDTLKKEDAEFLEQQKKLYLQKALEIGNELNEEFGKVEKEKISVRHPYLTSDSVEKKRLGVESSLLAMELLNHKQPKGFIENQISKAIMMDNRDFLSDVYDRISEQKPKDLHENDFNSSLMSKIISHFENTTNLKELENRTSELRSQRNGATDFLNAIDYGKPIDSISSFKNAYSGGAVR